MDPLVKKEIVKLMVKVFNFLPFYFFLLHNFISINNLSIFLDMYSFLRYSLYRGSGERRSNKGGADGEGEDDEGAAGEGGDEDGGSGTGES